MSSNKISMTCHCKAIFIHLNHKPRVLNECHCSICRRYAAQWAYYQIKDVEIVSEPDATEFYLWGDKMIEFHRCRKCGCVTHWAPADKSETRMAINGRLLEKTDREELPVKQTRRNNVDFVE
jgi:hypothetical protein